VSFQSISATICNPCDEAFMATFARQGEIGSFIGFSHGLRGLTDAVSMLLCGTFSESDVRWPFWLGVLAMVLKAGLIALYRPLASAGAGAGDAGKKAQ
jgi:ABC-type sulfate transport system permease component